MLLKKNADSFVGGADNNFYYGLENNLPTTGSLLAWDPVKQQPHWKVQIGLPYQGGVLSTAGGLVFQGSTEGEFAAFHAATGEKLWKMPVGSGILAAPSTVEVDGEQLIIVPAGSGTSSAVGVMPKLSGAPGGPARLLAFKLDGIATLSPQSPKDSGIPKPPYSRPPDAQVEHSEAIWLANGCELCHGYAVIAAGNASVPDLRLATKQTHEMFAAILYGARWEKGMPTFSHLSGKEIEALQAYILDRAWAGYDKQQAEDERQ